MADIAAALSSELTRIVDCPYPASLAGLADLLASVPVSTVRACIADRSPCAVKKLANIVCDALPLWAYTLRVLHYLCHAPEFRDELLLLKPGLVNALLAKATSSQQDFNDYADLCILLLSRPLPDAILLPSSAQVFFLRVFQRANHDASVETLKPVYCMLNGACRQLLGLLPHDAQQQFDQQLKHILVSSGAGKDSMLLLWCIGIALLAENPESATDVQTWPSKSRELRSAEDAKKQWKTASGQKLFVGLKGLHKTMTLVCMSVIWAVKGGVGVPDDEAIEGIRIASRVLRSIDQDVRESWSKSSSLATSTFTKLLDRLERTDTSPAIRYEAVCLYALIAGTSHLQPAAIAQYEMCLSDQTGILDEQSFRQSLSESLIVFGPHIHERTLQMVFLAALEACVLGHSAYQGSLLTVFIGELSSTVLHSNALRNTASGALSTSSLQDKLWALIRAQSRPVIASCSTYAAFQQQNLISTTIASLLTIVVATQLGQFALPQDLVVALIKKQQDLCCIKEQCLHSSEVPERSSISLFQQECTQYTGQHLQDWRTRLSSELQSQSHYHRDTIVRSVAQICQDLETRCNTVEEPLRRETEKCREFEQRLREQCKQISALETRVSDDELHLQGLDDEKDFLEQEKRELADAKELLGRRFEELKVEFAETNKEAAKILRDTQGTHKGMELELRSIILRHEEDNHAHAAEVQELNGIVTQLSEAREQIGEQYRTLYEQSEHMKVRFDQTERDLQTEREIAISKLKEMAHLQTRIFDVENQLHGTEAELELVNSKLSEVQVSHEEYRQASEDRQRDLEAQYSNTLEAAATKAEEERDQLYTQLQEAQQESIYNKDAYDETQHELERVQSSIPPLELRIQELTDLVSERESELIVLRRFRSSLLATIDSANQNELVIRSASSTSLAEDVASRSPHEPREHRRRKSALLTEENVPKPKTDARSIVNTSMETIANAPFASSDSHSSQRSGPAPKRPKPYPAFKVPAMQTPFTQNPALASKSASKRLSPDKRSALRQMSPNRRHTSVGFAVSEHQEEQPRNKVRSGRKRQSSLQILEQTDFDMDDDSLADTPLTPGNFMAGTGRVPEEDEDETATKL